MFYCTLFLKVLKCSKMIQGQQSCMQRTHWYFDRQKIYHTKIMSDFCIEMSNFISILRDIFVKMSLDCLGLWIVFELFLCHFIRIYFEIVKTEDPTNQPTSRQRCNQINPCNEIVFFSQNNKSKISPNLS